MRYAGDTGAGRLKGVKGAKRGLPGVQKLKIFLIKHLLEQFPVTFDLKIQVSHLPLEKSNLLFNRLPCYIGIAVI